MGFFVKDKPKNSNVNDGGSWNSLKKMGHVSGRLCPVGSSDIGFEALKLTRCSVLHSEIVESPAVRRCVVTAMDLTFLL